MMHWTAEEGGGGEEGEARLLATFAYWLVKRNTSFPFSHMVFPSHSRLCYSILSCRCLCRCLCRISQLSLSKRHLRFRPGQQWVKTELDFKRKS